MYPPFVFPLSLLLTAIQKIALFLFSLQETALTGVAMVDCTHLYVSRYLQTRPSCLSMEVLAVVLCWDF